MLSVNVSNPKALEAAIKSVFKFADIRRDNRLESTQQIMVQTADKGLRLTATDLYTSVEFAVNSSDVFSEGEFCIKATNLEKMGEIVKDQSAICLEQTENGVDLTLFDAPGFGATFEVSETDEFPMSAEVDPKAHWIEFDPEHIALVKVLAKYASAEKYRVGYDAIQFALADDTLYAYVTDGNIVVYAKLGRTQIPNFAIPVEAIKKALQVTNTPELKKSGWRVTLPSEEAEVVSIQIRDTAVKVRAGDALDLTDWILKHITYNGADDDCLIFDPKALTNGLKKVSKLFSKEKRVENIAVIEGNQDGNITMTAKAMRGSYHFNRTAVDLEAEYIHHFTEFEAECVTSANHFQINVDGRKFQSLVKDLSVSKPKSISVQAKYAVRDNEDTPNQDTIIVTATNQPLGFIVVSKEL